MKANALAPNWGQTIFSSANEIAQGTMFRTRLDEIQAQTDSEKEWWEKRRASIQSEFMKEIEGGANPTGTPGKVVSDDDAVLVETASNAGSMRKKKGKK